MIMKLLKKVGRRMAKHRILTELQYIKKNQQR